MLKTKNALANLCLFKEDIFISSFPGKIAFGMIDADLCYISKKSFVISRNRFCRFYECLLDILDDVVNNKDSKRTIFEYENCLYFYMVSKDAVKFCIEAQSETIFTSYFSLFDFKLITEKIKI